METILAQKKCTKCGLIKPIDDFESDKRRKSRKGSRCKVCSYKYTASWRSEHPEQSRAQCRKWYSENKEYNINRVMKYNKEHSEKHKEYIYEWHKNHLEKAREANRKSSKKNIEKSREKTRNRRAKKEGNGGSITSDQWNSILSKYGNKCLNCGRKDIKLTMDHIIPIYLGGRHSIDNVQPLCKSCNSSKGIKIIDYRQENL